MSEPEAGSKLTEELMSSYKEESEIGRSLNKRATDMITISATTTTLLNGFAIALLSRISTDFQFFNYILILLAIGIVLTVVSIFIFLRSSKPSYYLPIAAESFFDHEGRIQGYKIDSMMRLTQNAFDRIRIESYLEVIRRNSKINFRRSQIIYFGEISYIIDIAIILGSIGLQMYAALIGQVVTK
jgi:hypothetical protein